MSVQKTFSKITSDFYILNKEYFDSSLVSCVENQNIQIGKLKEKSSIIQGSLYKKRKEIVDLKFKLKDEKIKNHNLRIQLSDKEQEVDDLDTLREELEETKAEVYEILDELRKENQEQYEENQKLKEELERLRKKTMLNSTNSSIPSSQQGFREVKNSREKTGKSIGGQEGHKAHISQLDKEVDKVIEKRVKKAPNGAIPFFNENNQILYYATQEVDLVFNTRVIETRYFIDSEGEEIEEKILNDYKINPLNYSNHLKSMVLLMYSKGNIPYTRLPSLLKELSDGQLQLGASTICNWVKSFEVKSKKHLELLKNQILESKEVYVDETGWKIDGNKTWTQVMVGSKAVLYYMVYGRGIDEDGILPILEGYDGVLVHDHFKIYYRLLDCVHVECNAHILRYLQQGIDLDNNIACLEMQQLLKTMLSKRDSLLSKDIKAFEDSQIEEYEVAYHKIIDDELQRYEKENPNHKNTKYEASYIKLFRRMKEYGVAHLQFIHNFDIPFTNNRAEQSVRSIKMRKKTSGQSKTMEGARATAALSSVVETSIMRKESSVKQIQEILENKVEGVLN